MVLFCQLDVTGRTESDPAATRLVGNLLGYVSAWKPAPSRKLLYVGEAAGKAHLERAKFSPADYQGGPLTADQVLVVGPGAAKNWPPMPRTSSRGSRPAAGCWPSDSTRTRPMRFCR